MFVCVVQQSNAFHITDLIIHLKRVVAMVKSNENDGLSEEIKF